jgi:hypothetical protein
MHDKDMYSSHQHYISCTINYCTNEYDLKVGCLHPVACTRSGSGFSSNATLVVCIWKEWEKIQTALAPRL